GAEFVRRFMLHVLPTGIKRIRHYGVLASACKAIKLNAARLALQMPAVNPQAMESAQSPRVFRLSTRASCEPISRSTLPAPGCDAPPVRGIGTKTCLARPFLTS